MTNRSLTTLSRRQALTATAAVVASVATISDTKAAPGVSPELVAICDELRRLTALDNEVPELPSMAGYDEQAIEASYRAWCAACREMEEFPSRTAADLHTKIETLRDVFLSPQNRDSSGWVEHAETLDDWLGRDIAQLARRAG